MASTIEAPAEQNLDQPSRPDGRSFFMHSQLFYLENSDLFPAQEVMLHRASNDGSYLSLFLDVSQPNGVFTWQLISTNENGRTISTVSVKSHGEIEGWSAQYDKAGLVSANNDLDQDECLNLGSSVISFANDSGSIRQTITEQRLEREARERDLSEFVTNQEITITIKKSSLSSKTRIEKEYWDDKTKETIATAKVKVYNQKFREQLKKYKDRIDYIGFADMGLTDRPTSTDPSPYYWQNNLFGAEYLLAIKKAR